MRMSVMSASCSFKRPSTCHWRNAIEFTLCPVHRRHAQPQQLPTTTLHPHTARTPNSFKQLNAPLCKEACAEGQRKESDACNRAFTFRKGGTMW